MIVTEDTDILQGVQSMFNEDNSHVVGGMALRFSPALALTTTIEYS